MSPYRADHQRPRPARPDRGVSVLSGALYRLHHVTAPVVPVLMRIRRVWSSAPLGARSRRQHYEEHSEPFLPVHRFLGVPNPACLTRANDRLDRARVNVLDFADPGIHRPVCHFRRWGRVDHSITSSARARIEGGIASPRAPAVFRLTENLKWVGCSSGSSPGGAPWKMRTT